MGWKDLMYLLLGFELHNLACWISCFGSKRKLC